MDHVVYRPWCIALHYSDDALLSITVMMEICDVTSKPKQDEHVYCQAENVTVPQFCKQRSHRLYMQISLIQGPILFVQKQTQNSKKTEANDW